MRNLNLPRALALPSTKAAAAGIVSWSLPAPEDIFVNVPCMGRNGQYACMCALPERVDETWVDANAHIWRKEDEIRDNLEAL